MFYKLQQYVVKYNKGKGPVFETSKCEFWSHWKEVNKYFKILNLVLKGFPCDLFWSNVKWTYLLHGALEKIKMVSKLYQYLGVISQTIQ